MNTAAITARITSIASTINTTITTVEIEWSGPDDHTVSDFNIGSLGDVLSHGGDLRHGWVVLDGPCKLNEGDTIPLITSEEE